MKYESPQTRYAAKYLISVTIKLHREHDKDILEALEAQGPETGGKQGYIKRLIREDMKKREA